jgi:hypothetical protein
MFPSPCVLQHYVEFDIYTITMLEKLFGAGAYGGSIGHLAHHQATFPVSLGGLDLLSVVQIASFMFVGCWAFIAPTLVIRF